MNAPNITRKWKRIMAVGCSHGEYIDPVAAAAVIKFSKRWKPHTLVHLGDAFDMACLRTGAIASPLDSDYSHRVGPDLSLGFDFLDKLKPTHFLWGNHCARLSKLQDSSSAVVAHAAQTLIGDIDRFCERRKIKVNKEWGNTGWFKFGNYRFGHGILFGTYFLRQTAEAFGNCVVAHSHRSGVATADRDDGATAYCVGCLRTIESAGFANARKATLSWTHGFVWGEYCDDQTVLWLHTQPIGDPEWRLPV